MGRLFSYAVGKKVNSYQDGAAPFVPHLVLHPRQVAHITQRIKDNGGGVQVCSINHFHPEMLDSGLEMVDAMSKINATPANGGWRLLDNGEWAALQLATPGPTLIGADIVKNHPALRSGLGFATGNVLTAPLMKFLADVYDLRRFAVTNKPTRAAKMQSYYNLISHQTIFEMQNGSCKRKHRLARVSVPLTAWRYCAYYSAPLRAIMEQPNAFLHRHAHLLVDQLRERHGQEASAIALMITTRRFIDFAFLLWRDGLGDIKFEPERFFTRADEVEEFWKYTKNFDFLTDFS